MLNGGWNFPTISWFLLSGDRSKVSREMDGGEFGVDVMLDPRGTAIGDFTSCARVPARQGRLLGLRLRLTAQLQPAGRLFGTITPGGELNFEVARF